jgi:hypothetical protein
LRRRCVGGAGESAPFISPDDPDGPAEDLSGSPLNRAPPENADVGILTPNSPALRVGENMVNFMRRQMIAGF